MNIYEPGLSKLRDADIQSLKRWIDARANGAESTPLDSKQTADRVETSSLLYALYDQSDEQTRQKLGNTLEQLVQESIAQEKYKTLTEVIFTIARTETSFPVQVLIQFINDQASKPELIHSRAEVLAFLQGHIETSTEIAEQYQQWFWSDPMAIDTELAIQLFAGLIAVKPTDFPRLVIRLSEINKTLSTEKQFGASWVWIWNAVFENCSKEIIEAGVPQLPLEIQQQFAELCAKYPDIFTLE